MSTWNTVLSGIYVPSSNPAVGNVWVTFDRADKSGKTYQVKRRVTVFFEVPQIIEEGSFVILSGDLEAKHETEWDVSSPNHGRPKYWTDKRGQELASIVYTLNVDSIRDVRDPKPKKAVDEDELAKYGTAPF